MINRVDQLEIASFKLAQAVLDAMPSQYRDTPTRTIG